MEVNIIKEIKSLNTCLIKSFFASKDFSKERHPRPLQAEIINYLSKNQDKVIYQKDIEENLNISKSAISEVLNSMEKNGFIEKVNDEVDARRKRVILTKDTLIEHEEIREKINKFNKELTKGITDEELNTFISVVDKLKKNMRKEKGNV